MANPLLSAAEAVDLRKRLAEAEAARDHAVRERDAALLGRMSEWAAITDVDRTIAEIATRYDDPMAGARAIFDTGWMSGRARGELLLEQAIATAAERTRERDLAERERDTAARRLVKCQARCDIEMRNAEQALSERDVLATGLQTLDETTYNVTGEPFPRWVVVPMGDGDGYYIDAVSEDGTPGFGGTVESVYVSDARAKGMDAECEAARIAGNMNSAMELARALETR